MRRSFQVETAAPPPDLSDIVAELWQLKPQGPAYVPTQMFPSLSARLRFIIRDGGVETLVYGPSLSSNRKGLYFANEVSFGLTLKPAGVSCVFGAAAPELFSRRAKAKSILGGHLSQIEEQLISTTSFEERVEIAIPFLRSCRLEERSDDILEAAINEFLFEPRSVAAISNHLGVSRRTLHRKFVEFGVSPKRASRIVRLQRSLLDCIEAKTPSDQGLTSYADQSHFIREFKTMIGSTPGQFIAALPNLAELHHPCWSALNPFDYVLGYPESIRYE